MSPTLRQFEAFARVGRLGSFARAAEALGLSQPALSQTIAQMERLLGVKLFERTTRTVRLTPEGVFLLPRAEALLASVGDLVSAVQDQYRRRQARLCLGSLPSLATGLLPNILRRYREQHPSSEVAVTDGTSEILYAGVESGQLDLAISSRLPGHSGVAFQPLLRERFLLVIRRDHPLAAQNLVTWREALQHDFIAFLRGSGGQAAIEEALAHAGLVLNPVMTLAQSSTVLGMVEAGVGVTALPVLGCPAKDHRSLTSRVLVEPAVFRDVGIVHDPSRPPTIGMLALQRLTLEYLAKHAIPGIDPADDTTGGGPQAPKSREGRL